MERVAFVMRVKEGEEKEYRRRHREVWPAVEAESHAEASFQSCLLKSEALRDILSDFLRIQVIIRFSSWSNFWGPLQPTMDKVTSR